MEVDWYFILLHHLGSKYQRHVCVWGHQEIGFHFNPGVEQYFASDNAKYFERIIGGRKNLFSEWYEFGTLFVLWVSFFW